MFCLCVIYLRYFTSKVKNILVLKKQEGKYFILFVLEYIYIYIFLDMIGVKKENPRHEFTACEIMCVLLMQ